MENEEALFQKGDYDLCDISYRRMEMGFTFFLKRGIETGAS